MKHIKNNYILLLIIASLAKSIPIATAYRDADFDEENRSSYNQRDNLQTLQQETDNEYELNQRARTIRSAHTPEEVKKIRKEIGAPEIDTSNKHLSEDTKQALQQIHSDRGVPIEFSKKLIENGNISDDDLDKAHTVRHEALKKNKSLDDYLENFYDKDIVFPPKDSIFKGVRRWLHNKNWINDSEIAFENIKRSLNLRGKTLKNLTDSELENAINQKAEESGISSEELKKQMGHNYTTLKNHLETINNVAKRDSSIPKNPQKTHYQTINNALNDLTKGELSTKADSADFQENVKNNLANHLGLEPDSTDDQAIRAKLQNKVHEEKQQSWYYDKPYKKMLDAYDKIHA